MTSSEIIAITVCTRHRPVMLAKCLRSIAREIAQHQTADFLVVVENDEIEQSRHVIDDIRHEHPSLKILYQLEETPGIPFARNTAVKSALENGADWIAFIDDDETCEPGWLAAMRRGIDEFQSAVLTGPVRSTMPEDAPDWFQKPKFKNFERGRRLRTAATNNTLLSASWLVQNMTPPYFDLAMQFTGGSDTDFFYRLSDKGGTITWLDDAVVAEEIPASRLTARWQIQRNFRVAANAFKVNQKRNGLVWALFRGLPKMIGRLLAGIGLLLLAVLAGVVSLRKGKWLMLQSISALASAAGTFTSIFGFLPTPYKKIQGG
ncbi:MAG: glycosyltransferase family A protein [Pseudomonadota bacterium]